MSQIILIVGLIGLVLLYLFYKREKRNKGSATQEMVKCETCGINVPITRALSSGGKWYCSRAHKN